MPVRLPIGGITAAESEQCILRLRQRQIVRVNLNDQDCHVNVIEKVQIDMRHRKGHRFSMWPGKGHPHFGNITAAKYPDRRFLVNSRPGALPLSIEKSPDIGEKGDEFAVVAFLEETGITSELVRQLLPGIIRFKRLQEFPVLLDWRVLVDGHQLDRPKQNLPEVTDQLIARNCGSGHKGLRRKLHVNSAYNLSLSTIHIVVVATAPFLTPIFTE